MSLPSTEILPCARHTVREIFEQKYYWRPGFEIRPGDTVVDIGANIGIFSLWAAPLAGRVIAIEPTAAIEVLEQTLAQNGICNVAVVRKAVTDYRGHLDLLTHPECNTISRQADYQPTKWLNRLIRIFLRIRLQQPLPVQCPCDTLENILSDQDVDQIDFLKIDCEGGEYAILDSFGQRDFSRISKIAMEFHEFHPQHNHRKLLECLAAAGFQTQITRTLTDRMLKTGKIWAHKRH